MNKELYRGAREEYYLVIELIRQFYTEPRGFRVTGDMGDSEFIEYSNEGLQADVVLPDGSIRHRRPIFDISVSAEKQSPFSRAAQNEMIKELYGMGMFDPNNDLPALTCIDAMDFEGKDKLKQQIQQNGMFLRQFQSAMQLIQMVASVDPMVAQMAAEQGLIDPMMAQQMQMAQAQGASEGTTPEQRAAKNGTAKGDNSLATQARNRVANATTPR